MSESEETKRQSKSLCAPSNQFGILSIQGRAVDNEDVNPSNLEKIFSKLIPFLIRDDLYVTKDRAIIIDESDFELLKDGPKAYVYLPKGIEGNRGEYPSPPPKTEYEDDRWTLDRNALRTITGE